MNDAKVFPPRTILIVDDFAPWRRAVQRMFESETDLKIIGAAPDGLEAVEKAAEMHPDIILMDISLPGLNGFEATRQIRKACPAARILFVSEKRSSDFIKVAFQVGGLGYVLKSDCPEDLLPGIRAILRGEQFMSRSLMDCRDSLQGT
jgi:DNA-binding NarL/FixJ family response regulator